VEINGLVANHLAMVRRLIPENIHIDYHAAPQRMVTEADRGQMEASPAQISASTRGTPCPPAANCRSRSSPWCSTLRQPNNCASDQPGRSFESQCRIRDTG